MPKFKLRKGKVKEFSHCIDCWNAQRSNAGNTIRAIFDVIGGISHNYDTPSSAPWPKGTTLLKKPVPLARYFFNGTYGWIVNKSCHTQPSIKLKLSTNKFDNDHLNIPCPRITPIKVSAITDTGAQLSFVPVASKNHLYYQ